MKRFIPGSDTSLLRESRILLCGRTLTNGSLPTP